MAASSAPPEPQTEPPRETVVVGVVSDTHVPDRAPCLHPELLPALRAAGVSRILHAGDISARRVLAELEQVAPVVAVRGNRDILAGPLPLTAEVDLGGVRVALMHGHGGWIPYLWDKWKFILAGYNLRRYLGQLERVSPGVRVEVFGHTHFAENRWRKDRLLFNPGSASLGSRSQRPPTFGLLRITGQQVKGEIVEMARWRLHNRQWVER
jgi:uncharacterized protein